MEEVSGRDLTQFKRWYDQAGTPELTITQSYVAEDKTWTLHVKTTVSSHPRATHQATFSFAICYWCD